MNKNIRITAVTTSNNLITVHGTFGEANTAFEASPFQWAKKMLMKVTAEGLDRGTRVAIGIKSKAALRNCGVALPAAVLKRASKVTEVVAVQPAAPATELIVEPTAMLLADLQTTADPIVVEIAVEGDGGTDENCTFSMLLL